jgi:hypothetical protein
MAAVVLGIALLVFQLTGLLPLVWHVKLVARDLSCYIFAGRALAAHQPIYVAPPVFAPYITPRWYLYPPQLAILFAPLAPLHYMTIVHGWYVIELASFWFYAAILARIAGRRWSAANTLAWSVALWLIPDMGTVIIAENVDCVLWVLYGLGFLLPQRGLLWALIAQVKPFPVPALILACFTEGRKTWLPALAVMAVGYGAALLICGPHAFAQWLSVSGSVAGQGTVSTGNVSPVFAIARIAEASGHLDFHRPLPMAVRHAFALVQILALAGAFLATRRLPNDYRYAIVTAATVLSSPLCWVNYLPLLLVIPALMIRDRAASPRDTAAAAPAASAT